MRPYALRVLFAFALILCATFTLSSEGSRCALVIGNAKYATGPLRNPANDATDMAAALKEIGFKVTLATDANKKTMFQLIDKFGSDIKGADLALFYYSGHGVQADGENYLIPVGADINAASDVELEGVQLQRLISRMNSGGAGTNVVILDACRNNPFPQAARGMERGLAVVGQKPPESVIVYATEAGETAEDGGGRNGVFTAALLKNIRRNEELTRVLRDVNAEVRQVTGQKQKPAKYDNLTRDVYLTGLASPGPAAGVVAVASAPGAQKVCGSLAVSVAAEGELFVDGRNVGELPAGGKAAIPDIEVGDRALALRYSDGQVEKQTATVLEGRSTSVVFGYRQGQSQPVPSQPVPNAVPQAEAVNLPTNFVFVPSGSFVMGSSESERNRYKDEVQHQVSLSSFAISKYDLTFDEYDAYCQATGAAKPKDEGWGRGSQPVINVSWYDAVAYCNWRSTQEGRRPAYAISGKDVSWDRSTNGYRLPTEAEWEYAAKGGPQASSLAVNAVYAGSAKVDQVAWYSGNSAIQTHPVGQKEPNSLGLYDMAGNVAQWCWDWFGSYSAGSQHDPTGTTSGGERVVRGGSWYEGWKDVRSAVRGGDNPDYRCDRIGFRLLCPQLGM
jgi:formylglycine-generating enzyme required for sulfatase activity